MKGCLKITDQRGLPCSPHVIAGVQVTAKCNSGSPAVYTLLTDYLWSPRICLTEDGRAIFTGQFYQKKDIEKIKKIGARSKIEFSCGGCAGKKLSKKKIAELLEKKYKASYASGHFVDET